mmetsp:Transcript_65454/g.147575  ORF Transcript_65454/g.147575 Transcript_65454/m.147575 type:complete len:241 (+) Transcript_65454:900-1622(+)
MGLGRWLAPPGRPRGSLHGTGVVPRGMGGPSRRGDAPAARHAAALQCERAARGHAPRRAEAAQALAPHVPVTLGRGRGPSGRAREVLCRLHPGLGCASLARVRAGPRDPVARRGPGRDAQGPERRPPPLSEVFCRRPGGHEKAAGRRQLARRQLGHPERDRSFRRCSSSAVPRSRSGSARPAARTAKGACRCHAGTAGVQPSDPEGSRRRAGRGVTVGPSCQLSAQRAGSGMFSVGQNPG